MSRVAGLFGKTMGFVMLFGIALNGGCNHQTATAPSKVVARIAILRPSPTWGGLGLGQPITFTALAYDAQGLWIPDAPAPMWTSRNPAIATVNSSGRVDGVSGGSVTIVASEACGSATCADSISFLVIVETSAGKSR